MYLHFHYIKNIEISILLVLLLSQTEWNQMDTLQFSTSEISLTNLGVYLCGLRIFKQTNYNCTTLFNDKSHMLTVNFKWPIFCSLYHQVSKTQTLMPAAR